MTLKKSKKTKSHEKALKIAAGLATATGVIGLLLKNKDKIQRYLESSNLIDSNIDKALVYKNQQIQENVGERNVSTLNSLQSNNNEGFIAQNNHVNTSKLFPENSPIQVIINNYNTPQELKEDTNKVDIPIDIPQPVSSQNQCLIM